MSASFAFCIILLCVLLYISSVQGGCLKDSDTLHAPTDYINRMFSYASSQPRQASESNELKFMTFNLQSGYHYSCLNDPTIQAQQMIGMDFVGTQETVQNVDTRCNSCNIPNIIADVAGMSTRFAMAMPWRTGQYGTSAGTTQPILDTKWTLISYVGVEPRVVIALKTMPAALQGKALWFINIHVEYYVWAARQAQIAQILAFIQLNILGPDPTASIVMTGDFNGGPEDQAYRTLQGQSFKNSWETFSGSSDGGYTIPADWPGWRIDHIWFRAGTGVNITVMNAAVSNVLLSDHRPSTATLKFEVESDVPLTPTVTVAPTAKPTSAPSTAPTTRPSTPAPTAAPTPKPTPAPTPAPTNPAASTVCVGPIYENTQVSIACPNPTQKMTQVLFASYGTPTGSCGNFQLGNCVGGSSVAVVVDKCLNSNSCSFLVSNNVFGDPCPHTGKRFQAQVLCT